MRVLVTRPKLSGQSLVAKLTDCGFHAMHVPMIIIEPLSPNRYMDSQLQNLSQYEWLIFISIHAVKYGLKHLQRLSVTIPNSCNIVAIGATTSKALQNHGVTVDVEPEGRWDSEALLALPALQSIAGDEILIFRGLGGREALADGLRACGAKVSYLECYRRTAPQDYKRNIMHSRSGNNSPREAFYPPHWLDCDVVVTTSMTCLENLYQSVVSDDIEQILNKPLLVISERMFKRAKQLGFRQLLYSQGPQDHAIIECLQKWQRDDNNGR